MINGSDSNIKTPSVNGGGSNGNLPPECKEGKIKLVLENGDIYEGEIKNDLLHGNGKLISSKSIYEGGVVFQWEHGRWLSVVLGLNIIRHRCRLWDTPGHTHPVTVETR